MNISKTSGKQFKEGVYEVPFLMKPAAKALAATGLTFGAEKALKKIFGCAHSQGIELYELAPKLQPQEK